jgi:uncharacterized membrane protein
MHGLTGVRVVSRLIAVVVLVASGVYLLLYLYRWEWNRALMAGIFFLGAELALIGTAIVTRLRNIEAALNSRGAAASVDSDTARKAEGRSPFAWLEESSGGFNVFIPILLGAGVILSVIAWMVERLARFVTAPVSGEAQVSSLSTLQLSRSGLVPSVGATLEQTSLAARVAPGPSSGRSALHILLTVAIVTALLLGVWFLREAAESRPESGESGTTTLELTVATRESGDTTEQITDALWVACRLRLPSDAELLALDVTSNRTAKLAITPALGRTERRKFVGCLEDAVIDRVSAEVTRFETQPESPR